MSCHNPITPIVVGYTIDASLQYDTPPSLTPNTIPTWAQVQAFAGGSTPNAIRKAFTALNTLTIDWQSEKPDGFTQTYFELLGNYVEGSVYANGIKIGEVNTVVYDGSNNVQTVTADWGITKTGYIRFY